MGMHYENLDETTHRFILASALDDHHPKSVMRPMSREGILHSPSQFRAFLDHAPIGIAIAQCENYCFVLVNRMFCKMMGYSEEELLTLNCSEITFPEDLLVEEPLSEALIAGKIDSYELEKRFVRRDGSVFWGHLTAAAVRDDAGRLLYVQGMVLNIDERRRHQDLQSEQMAKLEQLQQLKDDFLSTVSHELRTPLTNMRLALHLLEQPSLQKRETIYMELLKRECKRELDLVNDLLDLQRSETGTVEPQWCDLCLQPYLTELLARFVCRLEEQSQQLRLDLPDTLLTVRTDRTWLERSIAELLTNACKYTPPEAVIAVRLTCLENRVQIIVGNNGPQIPAEALPRLFEKFYRVPGSDLRCKSGTGLGLALVHNLLERMGGTISVVSHSDWTEFTITLPRAD